MTLRFLMAGSETPEQQRARRKTVGGSSAQSFAGTLKWIEPGCSVDLVSPAEEGEGAAHRELATYDAVFFSGSPIQVYEETPAAARSVSFMRSVFAAGVPAFGSCAGLQLAAAAAGGRSHPRRPRMEAGFARRITRTASARDHPLLEGRPPVWDAPTMHADEVCDLPEGAMLLATNGATRVQAAEIRHENGIFWGVQYHPELSLFEIAEALRRQSDSLISDGLARNDDELEAYAARIEQLHGAPERIDLAWQLGIEGEVLDPVRRTVEIRNFIKYLAKPRSMERHERSAA